MLIIPFNVVYVDGQDIAAKLSKQITQRTNSIRSSVVKYNAGLAFWNDQFEGLPEALQFDEVKDPESEFYLHFRGASSGDIPLSVKRKVIDLHNFVCRCKEEINYLELEMKRLVLHYESEKTKFQAFIDEHDEDPSVSITGLKCLLQQRIYECDNKLSTLRSQFSIHLPDEILSDISDKEYKFMSMLECESDKDFEIFDTGDEFRADGDDFDDDRPDDDVYDDVYDEDDDDDDDDDDDEVANSEMDIDLFHSDNGPFKC